MSSFEREDSSVEKETADVLEDLGKGGCLYGKLEYETEAVS